MWSSREATPIQEPGLLRSKMPHPSVHLPMNCTTTMTSTTSIKRPKNWSNPRHTSLNWGNPSGSTFGEFKVVNSVSSWLRCGDIFQKYLHFGSFSGGHGVIGRWFGSKVSTLAQWLRGFSVKCGVAPTWKCKSARTSFIYQAAAVTIGKSHSQHTFWEVSCEK